MGYDERYTIKVVYESDASRATAGVNQFRQGISQTSNELSAFQQVSRITAGILGVNLVHGAVSAVKEGMQLAQTWESVSGAFGRLTEGINKEVISLDVLRSATKNTVADVDLLTTANLGLNYGIPVERMQELYRVASILGPAMGVSVTQAVENLTYGFGRQSIKILDNLGIMVDADRAYREFAVTLGKTVEELTDAERRTAFFTKGMEQATEQVDKLEGSTGQYQIAMEKANTVIKNAKMWIGELPAASLAAAMAFGDWMGTIVDLSDETDVLNSHLILTGQIFDDLAMGSYETREKLGDLVLAFKALDVVAVDAHAGFWRLSDAGYLVTDSVEDMTKAVASAWDEIERFKISMETTWIPPSLPRDIEVVDTLGMKIADLTQLSETLRFQQTLLNDAYKDGTISEEAFEDQSTLLTDALRDVGIALQLARAEADNAFDTTAIDQFLEALEKLEGPPMVDPEVQRALDDYENQLDSLTDELEDTGDESSKLQLEQSKLQLSYNQGKISADAYKKKSDELRDKLLVLRIKQQELRIAIDDTTEAYKRQKENMDVVTGVAEESAEASVKTAAYPAMTNYAGVSGKWVGNTFMYTNPLGVTTSIAGMTPPAAGNEATTRLNDRPPAVGSTVNITVNADVDAEGSIDEIAKQIAEKIAEQLRIRGITP